MLLTREWPQVAENEQKVVRARMDGFEKSHPVFWFIWDYTLGLALAVWVLLKSMFRIWTAVPLAESVRMIFINSKQRQRHVRKGREMLRGMKTTFFNRSSVLLQHFCRNVTNAAALDDVYNSEAAGEAGFCWPDGKPIRPLSAPIDPVGRFFLACPNGQAVRNRCRGVEAQFETALKEVLARRGRARVLSIACGSAQALIRQTALLTANGLGRADIKLTLTDMTDEPLALAKERARQAGILDRVEFVSVSFQDLLSVLASNRYDIVEACGIDDYLPDRVLVQLFKLIYSLMENGGYFITSNMVKTRAARILLWTYNWSIIYRKPEALLAFLESASFRQTKVFVEPWGIHAYATARKQ